MKYAIELAYNGTPFIGWQAQSEGKGVTVQQTVEDAIQKVTRQEVSLMGCGRTDTGVHAKYFVAHFVAEPIDDLAEFVYRLNKTLPDDIAIFKARAVSDKFHARFSPTARKYEYHLHKRKDPFLRPWSYYRYGELDLSLMNEAAAYLATLTNFKSFSKTKTNVHTYNCRIDECFWEERENGKVLVFHVKADRFLRNMVRAMVGTLIDIGTGKMSLDQLKLAMQEEDRRATGKSVPANGLYLTEIEYNWKEYES
ncbi:MAG: tRNA pseudouridine(38-40) synthase TruA [Bacteroidetes bacterium]|nr:MAG: tRNA pseudouridine(38-40) synthase TruA [Bacteroidota bacterium]